MRFSVRLVVITSRWILECEGASWYGLLQDLKRQAHACNIMADARR